MIFSTESDTLGHAPHNDYDSRGPLAPFSSFDTSVFLSPDVEDEDDSECEVNVSHNSPSTSVVVAAPLSASMPLPCRTAPHNARQIPHSTVEPAFLKTTSCCISPPLHPFPPRPLLDPRPLTPPSALVFQVPTHPPEVTRSPPASIGALARELSGTLALCGSNGGVNKTDLQPCRKQGTYDGLCSYHKSKSVSTGSVQPESPETKKRRTDREAKQREFNRKKTKLETLRSEKHELLEENARLHTENAHLRYMLGAFELAKREQC